MTEIPLLSPHWVTPEPIMIRKNSNTRITAVPAIEGEVLETVVDGFVVTSNTARAGDMKVSRVNGDSYFLGSNFRLLYHPTAEATVYAPTSRTLKALKIKRNVTFPAPWGTRQSIPAGGFIVEDADGDRLGVHQQSFEATYEKCEADKSLACKV